MNKPIFLDIMSADGTFIQQMRYDKRGFPHMVNGKVIEAHNYADLEDFVYSKRPSLRNKNITIVPTNQRVY